MSIPEHHIWYYPEYNADYYDMSIIEYLAGKPVQTIDVQGVQCNLHSKDTISVNISGYDWRTKWYSFIPAIKQVMKSRQFFKTHQTTSIINLRLIMYHTERIHPNEWSMFLASPFRVDLVVRSLSSIDKTYLSKTYVHRIPAKNDGFTWKELPWQASANKIITQIQTPTAFKRWREIRDLLYEWLLFNIQYEEAIYYVFKRVCGEYPLSIQMKVLSSLLSLLSLLSTNLKRETIKPSIRATTSQHTFYVLEKCLLEIAHTYSQNQPKTK